MNPNQAATRGPGSDMVTFSLAAVQAKHTVRPGTLFAA